MWVQLIKVATLSTGALIALIVGVAASAAMVSNAAELSNTPTQYELPSATPSAVVSETPANHAGASGLIKECVSKYTALRADGDRASHGDRESTTAVCKAAIEQTGLNTAEFAEKYGLITLPTVPAPSPKTEHKDAGLYDAIKRCLVDWRNYAETTSAACAQALAASGLSADAFWKKFEEWAVQQAQDTEPTPTSTPTPKATPNDLRYQLITTCIKLHNALTSTSDPARVTAAYDACNKAIAATGLTAAEFWAKFAKELAPAKPSPTATPRPVTNPAEVAQLVARCLELYKGLTTTSDPKAVSDACKAAIQASSMTSADFWAKYRPATN